MLSTFLFLFSASIRKSPSFKERLVRALSPKSLRRKANEEGGGGGGGDATFYDSDVYITPIPLEGKGRDSENGRPGVQENIDSDQMRNPMWQYPMWRYRRYILMLLESS